MDRGAVFVKILLFGLRGQVSQELQRTLLPLGELIVLSREEANFAKPEQVLAQLEQHEPDIVVNGAAYTAVDKAETEAEQAFAINAETVSTIAHFCQKANALMVHYSTDYVFDGKSLSPYLETDATNPLSVYGRSKRAGELAMLDSGCKALIFRTSWVYSANGNNFIRTMLRLAKDKTELRVVDDQFGAPTSAELIADVTSLAINAYVHGLMSSGIFHLSADGVTSWCQLARYVIDGAIERGAKLAIRGQQVTAITTSDFPTAAARPNNSVLNSERLSQQLSIQIPHWQHHVDRMLDQLQALGEFSA